jgi:hypothetical protein
MKSVEEKFGVTVNFGGGTYDETTFNVKLTVKTTDKEALEKNGRIEWDAVCELYGFKKEDYKAKFQSNGVTYTAESFMPRRSKFNLLGFDENGKRVLFVARQIAKKLHPEKSSFPNTYIYEVWVHPIEGGDDYKTTKKYIAKNDKDAEKQLKEWLAEVSDVTNDYRLVSTV